MTEQKRAEAWLRASEERFRSTLESIGIPGLVHGSSDAGTAITA